METYINNEILELDHQNIRFGIVNTALAWKIFSRFAKSCNISRITSHPECLETSTGTNATIESDDNLNRITLPSYRFQISGRLADFSISSSSIESSITCPHLSTKVRFNGK